MEEEFLLDTAGNAPAPVLDSTADMDLAAVINPELGCKRKDSSYEVNQDQEAMAKEMQLALDLSRREATKLARSVLRSPFPLIRQAKAGEKALCLIVGGTTTHANGRTI